MEDAHIRGQFLWKLHGSGRRISYMEDKGALSIPGVGDKGHAGGQGLTGLQVRAVSAVP